MQSHSARFHGKHHRPPPQPRQRRKSSASSQAGDDDTSSSSSSASNPPATSPSLTVVHGSESVILCWLWDLHPTEKKDVLAVTLPDIQRELAYSGITGAEAPVLIRKAESRLSDSAYLTTIRRAFVDALHSEGQMECTALLQFVDPTAVSAGEATLDPVTSVIISLLEAQLSLAHQRKATIVALTTLAAFYFTAVSSLTSLLRYPLVLFILFPAVYVATAQTSGPLQAPNPNPRLRRWQRLLSHLTAAFESDAPSSLSPAALRIRVESLCAWLLVAAWSGHQSVMWYWVLMAVCSLTSVALELHLALLSHRERLLWFVSAGCRHLSQLQLLWLSWYSWSSFAFCLLFFFPSATTVVLSSACVATATIVVPAQMLLQSRVASYSSHPILFLVLYLLTLLYLYLYWASTTYLLTLPALFAAFLLTPPFLSSLLSVSCTTLAQLLLALGTTKLLVLATQLAALLLLSASMLAAGWAWPRVSAWWERTGWGRGWKTPSEVGGWRWRVEGWGRVAVEWLMHTWAASPFAAWLDEEVDAEPPPSEE